MIHYFTSVTSNYIPKARTLAKSIKKHDPKGIFHLLLSDNPPEGFDLENEPFDYLIRETELGIPMLQQWIFTHTVVELCTAVKGRALEILLNQDDAEIVYYFDPDTVVFTNLNTLHEQWTDGDIALTPHLTVPEDTRDGILDNELSASRHGIFNLGFVGVRKSSEGKRFAAWWRSRLDEFCYDDIPNGLFTDQKWCDHVPVFFPTCKIILHPGCNVSTWNLSHRTLAYSSDGSITVNEEPLIFYHFSGFDSGAQKAMLEKYAKGNKVAFDLRDWYIAKMEEHGQSILGKIPSWHAKFSDGTLIQKWQRCLFRNRGDIQAAYADPFKINGDLCDFNSWCTYELPKEHNSKNDTASSKSSSTELTLIKEITSIKSSRSYKLARQLASVYQMLKLPMK
jgi:hypothetical protein